VGLGISRHTVTQQSPPARRLCGDGQGVRLGGGGRGCDVGLGGHCGEHGHT
jgi:hypothetical protein